MSQQAHKGADPRAAAAGATSSSRPQLAHCAGFSTGFLFKRIYPIVTTSGSRTPGAGNLDFQCVFRVVMVYVSVQLDKHPSVRV